MRNLLAFVAAAALTVAGVGWYLGWYRVTSTSEGPGRKNVNIEVNTIKIGEDLEKGGHQVQHLIEKARQRSAAGKVPGEQEPAEYSPTDPMRGQEVGPLPNPVPSSEPRPRQPR